MQQHKGKQVELLGLNSYLASVRLHYLTSFLYILF